MQALRPHLRRCAWIALIAVFGLVLAPLVSQAQVMVAAADEPWGLICTAAGHDGSASSTIAPSFEQDSGNAAGHASAHLDHCPLCFIGLGPLPTWAGVAALPFVGTSSLPMPGRPAPSTASVWLSAQPRAPPTFC